MTDATSRSNRARAGLFALLLASCSSDGDGDGDTTAAGSSGSTGDHTDHGGSTTGDATTSTATGADESSSDGGSGASAGDGSSTGGPVMDTWENWAHPEYFVPYCIECHPGQSTRDFNVYEVVVENVVHIRCGSAPEMLADCDDHIEPGHLPIGDGPFPSDDERWRLVAWIDAGMPRDP